MQYNRRTASCIDNGKRICILIVPDPTASLVMSVSRGPGTKRGNLLLKDDTPASTPSQCGSLMCSEAQDIFLPRHAPSQTNFQGGILAPKQDHAPASPQVAVAHLSPWTRRHQGIQIGKEGCSYRDRCFSDLWS